MAIDGIYNIEFTTPRGKQSGKVKLKTDGNSLSGTYTTERGEQPLTDGKVTGDEVEWSITVSTPAGQMKNSYKGKVSGDELSGQVQGGFGTVTFTGKRLTTAMAIERTYNIEVTSPRGTESNKVTLKIDGASLSGFYTTAHGSTASFYGGTVNGDNITWTVYISGMLPIRQHFNGTVKDNEISGTVQFGSFVSGSFKGKLA